MRAARNASRYRFSFSSGVSSCETRYIARVHEGYISVCVYKYIHAYMAHEFHQSDLETRTVSIVPRE